MTTYKRVPVTALILILVAVLITVSIAADNSDSSQTEQPGWEIPIAAGVWYPQSGPLPEKPMRYYRVRCWPGCHSGSQLGKYPKRLLAEDEPIFSTSTADGSWKNHPDINNKEAGK